MITQNDLNVFQSCRRKWKYSQLLSHDLNPPNPYIVAIKRTIFQMYVWLQEKNKLMSENQARERWDRNWWTDSSVNEEAAKEFAFQGVNGWLTVRNFWEKFYLSETYLTPIAVNFEFSTYIQQVHYRIHADVILVTKTGEFTLRQLGPKRTHSSLYDALETRLEFIGCMQTLNIDTLNKSYVSLQTTTPQEILLQPPKTFLEFSHTVINDISRSIANNIIYSSPNPGCSSCPFYQKCIRQEA